MAVSWRSYHTGGGGAVGPTAWGPPSSPSCPAARPPTAFSCASDLTYHSRQSCTRAVAVPVNPTFQAQHAPLRHARQVAAAALPSGGNSFARRHEARLARSQRPHSQYGRPGPQEWQTFKALWVQYKRELQLSGEAASAIADEVQQVSSLCRCCAVPHAHCAPCSLRSPCNVRACADWAKAARPSHA